MGEALMTFFVFFECLTYYTEWVWISYWPLSHWGSGDSSTHNLVYLDGWISVSCEKGSAISRPGQWCAVMCLSIFASGKKVGFTVAKSASERKKKRDYDREEWMKHWQFIDDWFQFQIKNLDTRARGGAKPISVRRENECVNLVTCFKGVEMLASIQVP